jgi:uncharacterized protein (UPF0212 family)
MRTLSAAEVLEVWEHASPKPAAERALDLVALFHPEASRSSLEALSIGQRDAALLALREGLFGSRMEAVVACPECGERLDMAFEVGQVAAMFHEAENKITLESDGYSLLLRPVNAADAIAASGEADLKVAKKLVVRRCLLAGSRGGDAIDVVDLPEEMVDRAVRSLAEADPMAEIEMALSCPSCDRRWSAALNIVSFLWGEIDAWAWKTLSEVQTLASAYGWSEEEILALSPNRRWCYLQMVGA